MYVLQGYMIDKGGWIDSDKCQWIDSDKCQCFDPVCLWNCLFVWLLW